MDKETLEEAKQTAWMLYEHVEGNLYSTSFKNGFELGAKWQAERMYSEEEVLDILSKHTEYFAGFGERVSLTEWFNQFKKK